MSSINYKTIHEHVLERIGGDIMIFEAKKGAP